MQPISAKILLAGLAPESWLSDTKINLVTTDSRKIQPGCVFVAFPGAKFDGHDFACQAVEQGAAYVVVNHPVDGLAPEKTILCPDSYRAMMTIGANYRSQFAPKLVGITGSVGKTTTKEFCYAVLSAFGNAIKTEGNQNNELGMPNTLLRLEASTQFAAVEMGMSNRGEISRLSRAARPDAGIITCIGVSHMENLGSRENILAAKLEICDGLAEGAPLVLNGDDPYLRGAQLPAHVKQVWFSLNAGTAEVTASEIHQEGNDTFFTLNDAENGTFAVQIPTIGKHNIANALAAYCVATRLGLDAATAAAALANFRQTGMRQHMVECDGVTVIEDCYNANPDSMKAALEMFATYDCKRRFALLGDMLELGTISESAHTTLGKQAAENKVDFLITYGDACKATADAAQKSGLQAAHTASYREIADLLLENVKPGDAILVKGSRGMALEKALTLFYAEWPQR